MKKTLLVLSGIILITVLMAFSGGGQDAHSTGGAPAGFAGDPSGGNVTCRQCHSGPNLPAVTGIFSSNIPPAGYTAGNTYTITANFVRAGHSKFGFQVSPQNSSGTKLGTLANISGTQLVGTGKYVTHITSSTSGSGSKTWNFSWTAPATGLGPVTFYGAFNATNNNNNDLGDSTFISTLVVNENPSGIFDVQKNNLQVSIFPNPTSDYMNLKFTLNETSMIEVDLLDIMGNKVSSLLTETELSGTVNRSFDISSFPGGIYFIRLNTGDNYSLQKVVKM